VRDRDWLLLGVAASAFLVGGTVLYVTISDREQFIDTMWDALALARPDLSFEARSVVVGQAVLETNGGRTPAWRRGFNFGNITAGSSWDGPVIRGGDLEYPAGGGDPKSIVQAFRAYASLPDAIGDFFRLLTWSRYTRALQELQGDADPVAYATALRAGNYFTAPLAEYATSVRDLSAEARVRATRRGVA
jgi:flagellum-specific peptidoglycan hydrolase FlgJ